MRDLTLATSNNWKLGHFKECMMYYKTGIRIMPVLPEESIEVEETGKTLLENAKLKAMAYYNKYHREFLADDTGLFVTALNGWPGEHTKRELKGEYGPLIEKMKDITEMSKRTAHFNSSVVYIDNNGNYVCCNTSRAGFIAFDGKGSNGIYTEQVFIPNDSRIYYGSAEQREKLMHYTLGCDELSVDRFFHQIFQMNELYDNDKKITFLDVVKSGDAKDYNGQIFGGK